MTIRNTHSESREVRVNWVLGGNNDSRFSYWVFPYGTTNVTRPFHLYPARLLDEIVFSPAVFLQLEGAAYCAANGRWLEGDLTEETLQKVRSLTALVETLGITGVTKMAHVLSNVKASEILLEEALLEKIAEILDNVPVE